MNYKAVLFFAFTLLLLSCSSPSGPIELDKGKKWTVNPEMMPPIKASEKLVLEYTANAGKDYKSLAKKLKENNQRLISSCNMSGKSHEELHKWLHPYMNLVKALDKANDEKTANEIIENIKQSFLTFNQYFQ